MYLLHYNVSAAVAGAPIIEQGTSAPLGAGRQLPETSRALVTIRDQCASETAGGAIVALVFIE